MNISFKKKEIDYMLKAVGHYRQHLQETKEKDIENNKDYKLRKLEDGTMIEVDLNKEQVEKEYNSTFLAGLDSWMKLYRASK